jgi:hypothetical protein
LFLGEVVKSRLSLFVFRNNAAECIPNFTNQIKLEIPDILVYCNHLYINSLNLKPFHFQNLKKFFKLEKSIVNSDNNYNNLKLS